MTRPVLTKLLIAIALFVIWIPQTFGQVVYKDDFTGLCGDGCTFATPYTTAPNVLATGLSNSQWATNYSTGFIAYEGPCGTSSCLALSLAGNNEPSATTVTLSFTVEPNYTLDITSLSFWNRESTDGPTTAKIKINGTTAVSNLALAGTTWANTGNLTPSTTFNNLTGTVTIVFSLTGATTANGTIRLDTVVINGAVSLASSTTLFNVTGGGALCAGGAGVTIGLAGSQSGYTYQLYLGGNAVGSAVAGTGSAISFGTAFTTGGIYTVVATNTSTSATTNMTGSATVVVNPLPVITPSPAVTTCAANYILNAGAAGSSYIWSNNATTQSITVTTSNYYSVTATSDSGCVATAIDTVTFSPNLVVAATPSVNPVCLGTSTAITASGGVSYVWSNAATTAVITVSPTVNPTTYTVTATGNGGCTGTATVNVTVSLPSTSNITQTVCAGQLYNGHGLTGLYIDTFANVNGCDSIVNLTLLVTNPTTTPVSQTICAGQTYQGHGASGNYNDTLQNVSGCDSVIVLTLTVTPAITSSTTQTICAGQSYNGHTGPGSFTDTLQSVAGCDSVVQLTLTVTAALTSSTSQIICNGLSYNGHNTTGNYTDTLTSVGGCDSIVILNLTVLPAITDTIRYAICKYDTFMGHTTTGTYRDTLSSFTGCDSIVVLYLKVHSLPYITDSLPFDTVCNNHVAIALTGTATPLGGTYYGQGVSNSMFIPSSAVLGYDTIYYTYTDTNGCTKSYWETAYVEDCDTAQTGIANVSANSFTVSPNPTQQYLTIENDNTGATYGFELFDLPGRLIINIPEGGFAGRKTIDMGKLPAGVYLLSIRSQGEVVLTQRVVKL